MKTVMNFLDIILEVRRVVPYYTHKKYVKY